MPHRQFSNPTYAARAFRARLLRVATVTRRRTPAERSLTTLVNTLVHINTGLDVSLMASKRFFADQSTLLDICVAEARNRAAVLADFGLTTESYLALLVGRTSRRWVCHDLVKHGANP